MRFHSAESGRVVRLNPATGTEGRPKGQNSVDAAADAGGRKLDQEIEHLAARKDVADRDEKYDLRGGAY
jgi:hypothetical protein